MVDKKRPAETVIGKAVVQWLEEGGWDVYQEVPVDGLIPDVVAIRGSVVAIVECKTSFGLDVMAQAERWVRHGPKAHQIYVAVPQEQKCSDARMFGMRMLRQIGIGLIEINVRRVDRDDRSDYFVRTRGAPLHRKADTSRILSAIKPEHKTFCLAGSATDKRFTPFVQTCSAILQFVKEHPNCTIGEAVRGIARHHYSSDKSALGAIGFWAERGKIPGVRVESSGKRKTLALVEENG